MDKNKMYAQFKLHLQKNISVSDGEFERIRRYFKLKTIPKKEYLLRPFQICKHESYIFKGLFQTSLTDESGRQHVLYFPHEDWWAGDFKSFKAETGSCMEIMALEDAVLLQISKPDLEELYRELPVFERFFRILNENAGIALQDRVVQNFSTNAEKKYEEFQNRYPALQNRLPNKRIAGFLGVTPEYFSQMLSKKQRHKT